MNILFLTAATGGGHVKAAKALIEYMEKNIPGCRTRLVDALKYINPLIDRLITGTYLSTVKKLPGIYGKLYDLSEKDETITDLVKGLNNLLSYRLYSLFKKDIPDAVICTHTMPLQMLARLKRKGLNIPVLGIVTDYTNHFFWKLKEIDAFIVAHDFIKEDMIRMGLHESCIHACGIPVSEHFVREPCDKALVLKEFGLENKPTILIMGGSLGFSDMQNTFVSLLSLKRDLQIIAVTGHNKRLKIQLETLAKDIDKNVRILGFTDKICELMDAASLIITKPGGITISEAFVKKLPILVMTPIPGQEERNARFLGNSGAAFRLTQQCDMEALLNNLLDRPNVLENMSDAAWKLAKPGACKEITCLVKKLIHKEPEVYCINQSVQASGQQVPINPDFLFND